MADKKKNEKDELMDKVFGKGAPNRRLTKEDLAALQFDPFDGEDLSPEWKTLQENSRKLQQQTQALLDQFSDADFEALKSEIRKDFGDTLPAEQQETLTIMPQENLNESFELIEKQLNEEVMCQKPYIEGLLRAFRRPTVMGVQNSGLKNAVLICGPVASGRHSSVTLAAKLLKQHEILSNDSVARIDLSIYTGKEYEGNLVQDLYTAVNNSQVIVFDNVDHIAAGFVPYIEEILTDGILTMNKRYTLNNKQLVETQTSLAKDTIKTISFKGKYLIFITTYKPEKLLEVVGTRFISAMGDTLKTASLTRENIEEIFPKKEEAFRQRCRENLKISVSSDEKFRQHVVANYAANSNVEYLNSTFDTIYFALSEYRLQHLKEDVRELTISANDEGLTIVRKESEEMLSEYLPKVMSSAKEEVKKELDQLVGLEEIKHYILSLEDFYEAQKIREKQGLKTTEVSKHMIFTGNPGTGKTTIARLIAKYLKAIGVLSNGQLVEVTRNDLVGKYMGHTAPQTMQVIKSALGGILFIDEAYSLYRGTNDSFGLEAIDTLVKAMEDYRDDLIVILAGYTREMKEFLTSNSGLQSRFPNQIEFPDYTGEELYAIAAIQAKSKGYRLAEEIREPLTDWFTRVQAKDARKGGNGRLARNVIEEAIINQSRRVLKDNGELDLLTLADLDLNAV